MAPRYGARINLGDIGREFGAAFHADNWRAATQAGVDPLSHLFMRSQGLDLIRQVLPRKAGGYSAKHRSDMAGVLRDNPVLERETLQAGRFHALDYEKDAANSLPWQQRAALTGAQVSGAIAKDIVTQGLQNVYWFSNAPEALALIAAQQGLHGSLKSISRAPSTNPFRQGSMRASGAFPLVLGAGIATGTLVRPDGYAAVLPDTENDRRQSTDPVSERVLRAIGRTGRLLPYKEFFEERPDVSYQQYAEYQRYQRDRSGLKGIVKGTLDGIHGPEVAILGRSVPVLTGMVPLLGGVFGARAGVRMAGARLAGKGVHTNQFRIRTDLGRDARRAAERMRDAPIRERPVAEARARQLAKEYDAQNKKIEGNLLGAAIGGGAAGLGVTAAGASLLENMRRAANMEAEKEKSRERRRRNEELAGGAA